MLFLTGLEKHSSVCSSCITVEHNFLNLRGAIKSPPELHGRVVVEPAYKDEGVTGATFKRPGQRRGNCPG